MMKAQCSFSGEGFSFGFFVVVIVFLKQYFHDEIHVFQCDYSFHDLFL